MIVDGFWMSAYPVTNREFGRFVGATAYVTVAERPPDLQRYPNADASVVSSARGPASGNAPY